MISRSFSYLVITFLVTFSLVGCEKNAGLGEEVSPIATLRIGSPSTCDELIYSDSLFYYDDEDQNKIQKPQKQKAGIYGAFPSGLAINPNTGAINVNKSESGLTYRVWFVRKGTTDTCSRLITISGINYRSRVYNLNEGDSLAVPFYNGAGNQACPCTKNQKNCDFNGTADALTALVQGRKKQPVEVAMDAETGTINLRKTLRNGLFGRQPTNGTMQEFRLFYRLNDKSKKALNYIDLRVHYYSRIQDVPASLLAQVNYKSTANFRIATLTPTPTVTMMNSEKDTPGSASFSTRPPDVVVVGH
jgi:hypothetical protein